MSFKREHQQIKQYDKPDKKSTGLEMSFTREKKVGYHDITANEERNHKDWHDPVN